MHDDLRKVDQAQVRIIADEMMQGSVVAEVDDDLVVVGVRAVQREGMVAL